MNEKENLFNAIPQRNLSDDELTPIPKFPKDNNQKEATKNKYKYEKMFGLTPVPQLKDRKNKD
jgi:hypothetical protein